MSEHRRTYNREFVENREPQGCFGADVEYLTGIDQDDVHNALAAMGIYDPQSGLALVSAEILTQAMDDSNLPLKFREILPFFNGFEGDEVALDASPNVVEERLETIRTALDQPDSSGLVVLYPCQRSEDQEPFAHFVALAGLDNSDDEAEFIVMDPSELHHPKTGEPIGGVFHKSKEEMLEILTPNEEQFIPVFAYSVEVS